MMLRRWAVRNCFAHSSRWVACSMMRDLINSPPTMWWRIIVLVLSIVVIIIIQQFVNINALKLPISSDLHKKCWQYPLMDYRG